MDGREYSKQIKTHIMDIENDMCSSGKVVIQLVDGLWVASFKFNRKSTKNINIEPITSETLNDSVYKLKLRVRKMIKIN